METRAELIHDCPSCARTWQLTWGMEPRRHSTPNADHRLFPHFKWEELSCRCCNHLHLTDDKLPRMCESIRAIVRGPIVITSGWRCPTHNADIGGSELHPNGLAADIATPNSAQRFAVIQGAIHAGCHGIGVGRTFVHCDRFWRTNPVSWTYYAKEKTT